MSAALLSQIDAALADKGGAPTLAALARELARRDEVDLLAQLCEGIAVLCKASPAPSGKAASTAAAGAKPELREAPYDGAWVTLPDVSLASPRGNFSCDFIKGAVGLRGKSGSYLIEASQVSFALSIPTKQGDMVLVQLTVVAGNQPLTILCTPKAGAKPVTAIPGPCFEAAPAVCSNTARRDTLFAQLLTAAFGLQELPVSAAYRSQRGEAGIMCKLRTIVDGTLYPTQHGLLFCSAPLLFLPLAHIAFAEVVRATSRTCILRVVAQGVTHEFSMIDEGELGTLLAYIAETRMGRQQHKTKSPGSAEAANEQGHGQDSDEDEDEDEEDSSFEDSDYSEESSSAEEEEEEQAQEHGADEGEYDTKQLKEARESSSESTGSGTSDRSSEEADDLDSDDDDVGDGNGSVAELVDEDLLIPEEGVLVPSGVKRQRRTGLGTI